MAYFKDIRDGQSLAQHVLKNFPDARVLARTEQDLPILAVKLGGTKKPGIVVKAGSHASEIGAIHGALSFLKEGIQTDHEVWVLPCASPFDFGGYNKALSHVLGKKVEIRSDAECLEVLKQSGRCIHEQEDFALFRVGELIFAWVDQVRMDPRALAYGKLDALCRPSPRLSHEVGGRRIFLPNFVYEREDYTSYDYAGLACWANWDGWVGNLNRFYDNYAPPIEVKAVRDFCEEVQPGLVIDMHESGVIRNLKEGDRDAAGGAMAQDHYLVLPPVHGPSFEKIETPVAEGLLAATRKAGFPSLSKEVLQKSWGFGLVEYFEGYIRNDQRPIFPFLHWGMRYDACIVIETGMAQPVETRSQIQATAVRGAIQTYDRLRFQKVT